MHVCLVTVCVGGGEKERWACRLVIVCGDVSVCEIYWGGCLPVMGGRWECACHDGGQAGIVCVMTECARGERGCYMSGNSACLAAVHVCTCVCACM